MEIDNYLEKILQQTIVKLKNELEDKDKLLEIAEKRVT